MKFVKVVVLTAVLMALCCGCAFAPAVAETPLPVNVAQATPAQTTHHPAAPPEPLADPTLEPTPVPTPEPTPEPVYYKSRVSTLNCRTSPTTADSGNIIATLNYEETVEFIAVEGEFTRVRLADGRECYCFGDYLVPNDTVLYGYVSPERAQLKDIKSGELVFEKDGVTPVMVKNELVDIRLYLPNAQYELLFATERNVSGAPLYPRAVPMMQKGTVEKLCKAYEIFKQDGYTLKVYDAYRPVRVQRILYEIVQNHHWIANPDTTASNHNRGCAIDMSLIIDATGQEIEVPTPMHTFSDESARTCKTWSETARKNVDYITEVMASCGFNSIESEWWHYSDKDKADYMTMDIDFNSITMLPKQEDNTNEG